MFLHKMNNCHVTCIIGPNINNQLLISFNTFDIVMEYWTAWPFTSNSGSDRYMYVPVHRTTSMEFSHLKYKIYMHILILKQVPVSASWPA